MECVTLCNSSQAACADVMRDVVPFADLFTLVTTTACEVISKVYSMEENDSVYPEEPHDGLPIHEQHQEDGHMHSNHENDRCSRMCSKPA